MNRADGILMGIAGLVAVAECIGVFIMTAHARDALPEFHAFALGLESCAVILGSAGLVAIIFGLFRAIRCPRLND